MKKLIFITIIAFCCISYRVLEANADTAGTYCLSVKSELAEKARITQFRISVTSGRIKFMQEIPAGWSVSIDNDPSWVSTIQANILVGAAALGLDKFNNLICIETIKLSGLEFKLEGEIASTLDFEKEKITKVTSGDFVLNRQKGK
ncbi:MAG: hypothetical protein A2511_08625 [Deltaproteobacteria bacterium RIFOXYD12_FULL_50_9]|nr:MAG: hypothetical protein A2511_08625 [Deltaproteobacteria bacterium RIFOXYD12_FULL_50_9]